MKMGTTGSPWLMMPEPRRALQSAMLRRPAILRCASWAGVLGGSAAARVQGTGERGPVERADPLLHVRQGLWSGLSQWFHRHRMPEWARPCDPKAGDNPGSKPGNEVTGLQMIPSRVAPTRDQQTPKWSDDQSLKF